MSKVWFITGAGSGLGKGIARAALRDGDPASIRNWHCVRGISGVRFSRWEPKGL